MENPKVYYSFDISGSDCKKCGAGQMYKRCDLCEFHPACAGWAEDFVVYCCECYELTKKEQAAKIK